MYISKNDVRIHLNTAPCFILPTRQDYCATSKDMERKMDELSAMGPEGIMENARKVWTRTAPADLYYTRDESNPKMMRGTAKLRELCELFKKALLDRAMAARALQV